MPPRSRATTAPTPPPPDRKGSADEFRRAAVGLVAAEGIAAAAAARRLGVNPEALRKWKRRYAPAPARPDSAGPDLAAEVRRLREQVRRLTVDRDILKKAATFFARESA